MNCVPRRSSIERRLVVFRHACPVKYIEDMERSEFNRGAGKDYFSNGNIERMSLFFLLIISHNALFIPGL
jgi:hypothetical protein